MRSVYILPLNVSEYWKRALASTYVRAVLTLVAGTAFAQGLMMLVLPLLTRLYTPEDFALLAVYVALISLITAVSCLRFNIAIPLPEDTETSAALLILSLAAALIVTVSLAIAILFFSPSFARLIDQPHIGPYLWLLPVSVLSASGYSAMQGWVARKKLFGLIAQTRVSRAICGAGTQIGFGVFSPSPFGLILGHILYMGMGTFRYLVSIWANDRKYFTNLTFSKLRCTFIEYRRYPLLSVPETFFDVAGIQIPILLIATFSVGPEAGYTMLAIQILGAPMTLIGAAVAQVYVVEAPDMMRRGELWRFTMETIWSMLKIGGPILLTVALLAPFLFAPIFGQEWARAGLIVTMLAPSALLQFLVSPVSMVLHITGAVVSALTLQVVGFFLRAGVVYYAAMSGVSKIVEIYAAVSFLYYMIYILTVLSSLKKSVR